MKIINICTEDMISQFKSLEDSSVDAIIQEPLVEVDFQEVASECLRVLRAGGFYLGFHDNKQYHRMVVGIEDSGFDIRDCITWLISKTQSMRIVVAQKPREGTFISNVLKNGVGPLNIDACRIATQELKPQRQRVFVSGDGGFMTSSREDANSERTCEMDIPSPKGRWPANVVLSHRKHCEKVGMKTVKANGHAPKLGKANPFGGVNDTPREERYYKRELVQDWNCGKCCAVPELDQQSGHTVSKPSVGKNRKRNEHNIYGSGKGIPQTDLQSSHDDEGGASRFFKTVAEDDDCPTTELDKQSGITKSNVRPPTGKALFSPDTEGRSVKWNTNDVRDTTQRGHIDEGGASRFFKTVTDDDDCASTEIDRQSGDTSGTRIGNPKNPTKFVGNKLFGGSEQDHETESHCYRDTGGASRYFKNIFTEPNDTCAVEELDTQAPSVGNAYGGIRKSETTGGTGHTLTREHKVGESAGISDGLSGASKFFYHGLPSELRTWLRNLICPTEEAMKREPHMVEIYQHYSVRE